MHVFMDYETFGEHQWAETGIFDFLAHVPEALERRGTSPASHPSSARPAAAGRHAQLPDGDVLGRPRARHQRLAWQSDAARGLRPALPVAPRRSRHCGDPRLLEAWRRLTTSDHCYYMCTKWFADGDVHKYFNPHASPYDAFVAFMNVLTDLERRCADRRVSRPWVLDGEMAVAG